MDLRRMPNSGRGTSVPRAHERDDNDHYRGDDRYHDDCWRDDRYRDDRYRDDRYRDDRNFAPAGAGSSAPAGAVDGLRFVQRFDPGGAVDDPRFAQRNSLLETTTQPLLRKQV